MVLAAPGKLLVDFGMRRAHGAEAGLHGGARELYRRIRRHARRCSPNELYGIPIYGTMAHSYIQAHDDEIVAFESFARARPKSVTLLIDTYDTEAAARKVVALAPRLKADGIAIRAVRIDSGDLVALSRRVRRILDAGGFADVEIFASGGLDEDAVAALRRAPALRSTASASAPA